MKIEHRHWKIAYDLGLKVYQGDLRLKEAKDQLAAIGLNTNSATNLIRNLRHILEGEEYRRAMSKATTDDFLTWILRDFGNEAYAKAISSVRKHLDYYTSFNGDKLPSHREVLAKHEAELSTLSDSFNSPEEL